jgi:hypothetical protein
VEIKEPNCTASIIPELKYNSMVNSGACSKLMSFAAADIAGRFLAG